MRGRDLPEVWQGFEARLGREDGDIVIEAHAALLALVPEDAGDNTVGMLIYRLAYLLETELADRRRIFADIVNGIEEGGEI